MSAGEWVILLLNTLAAGTSASLGLFTLLWGSLVDPMRHTSTGVYLIAGSLFLVALAAGVTALLLLLRQTRPAAWFQWLVCLGVFALAVVTWPQWSKQNMLGNLVDLGALLLVLLLFVFSGRFLRAVDNEE